MGPALMLQGSVFRPKTEAGKTGKEKDRAKKQAPHLGDGCGPAKKIRELRIRVKPSFRRLPISVRERSQKRTGKGSC